MVVIEKNVKFARATKIERKGSPSVLLRNLVGPEARSEGLTERTPRAKRQIKRLRDPQHSEKTVAPQAAVAKDSGKQADEFAILGICFKAHHCARCNEIRARR